ncbi:MAG: hypothetical protein AB7T49_13905 [Oligoflexales bacterium]
MNQKLFDLGIYVTLSWVMSTCVTTKPSKPQDSATWSLLKDVAEVPCEVIPVSETVLDYQKVGYSSPIESLLINARARNGRPVFYKLPYPSFGPPTLEKVETLKVTNEETFMGIGTVFKTKYMAVGKNTQTDPKIILKVPTLEGTTLATGKLPFALEDAAFSSADEGLWVISKHKEFAEEPSALDDRPSSLHYFKVQKNILTPQSFSFQMLGQTQLLTYNQKHAVAIWLDEGTSEKPKPGKFKLRLVSNKGVFSPEVILADIVQKVEQWSAVVVKDGLLLATIEGDSVMGDANLRVTKVQLGAKGVTVVWQKTKSLTNEHVSDPFWVTRKDGVYLYLPKWLDSDVTLSLYQITNNDVKSIGSMGVFSEGTTFQSLFTLKNGGVVSLSSTTKNNATKHLLCEVTPPSKL